MDEKLDNENYVLMKTLEPVLLYTENEIVQPLLYSHCISEDIFLTFMVIEVTNV